MRLVLLGILAAASWQTVDLRPARAPRTVDAKQLSVTTSQSNLSVVAGAKVTLFVDVRPKAKMHVYAPEQKGGYIRIELTLDRDKAFATAKPLFPKASDYYFAPLKETFKVFAGPFRITQGITIARRAKDPLAITGTVRYQACDDEVCYRPDEIPVSWTVAVRPAVTR